MPRITNKEKPLVKKPRAVKKVEPVLPAVVEVPVEDADFSEEKMAAFIKSNKYLEDTGRRKTSVARVRLSTQGDKVFLVNDKLYDKYFPTNDLQQIASASLKKMKCQEHFRVQALVSGGGIHSQAEAVRHGIARVLVQFNSEFRKRLRRAGHLTRDPRMRERKKFGLKRARRAPQWNKR